MSRLIAATTVAATLLAAPSIAEACSCSGSNYELALAESTMVFRGTIIAWEGPIATVEVQGYVKGEGPRQLAIRGRGTGMCVREFAVGATYMVFAQDDLNVGYCDETFRISDNENTYAKSEKDTAALLVELGVDKLSAPNDGPPLGTPPDVPSAREKLELENEKRQLAREKAKELAAEKAKLPHQPEPSGCMSRVDPQGGSPLLVLLAFPLWLRRRS